MREKSRVKEALDKLTERASQDQEFLNYLDALDVFLSDKTLGKDDSDTGRSQLPYSSEPPICEAAWN